MRKKNLFLSFLLGLCFMGPGLAVAQYDMDYPVSYRMSDTGLYLQKVYPPYEQMQPRPALYYYASQANKWQIYQITQNGYSIDIPDAQGNTALCEAVLRSDEVAVRTLVEMGARQNAMCMQRIPAVLKNVVGLDPENVKMVDVNATPEISMSKKVSGSLGVLAVVGGGIALGMSGGGSGGSSSGGSSSGGSVTPSTSCNGHGSKNKNDLCVCDKGYAGEFCEECDSASSYEKNSSGLCVLTLKCVNGTQSGDVCKCSEGWKGTLCDEAEKCTSEYKASCSEGYTYTTTCRSGNQTLYKCDACAEGYGHYGTKECYPTKECKNGTQQGNECVCSSGYVNIGEKCYPKITCAHGGTQTGENTCSCIDNWDPSTKCTTCLNGTIQSDDGKKCIIKCGFGEYFTGDGCVKCKNGGYSAGGSVQECSCDSSKNWRGPGCDECLLSGPHEESTCQCSKGTFQFEMRCISLNPGAAPKEDNKSDFQTTEFTKGNFLAQIKADAAYARGYTGYIVNRDNSGVLKEVGGSIISDKKITVGVMDNYLDVTHPDLQANLYKDEQVGRAVGYNFDYGPCRGKDTQNCFALVDNRIVFYNDSHTAIVQERFKDTDAEEAAYFNKYAANYPANYDWDSGDTKYQVGTKEISDFALLEYANAVEEDHGTHVSGIIAATSDGNGMQGVVPNATLVFTQANFATDLGGQSSRWFLSAMEKYASEKVGAKVINMSWGRDSTEYLASYNQGRNAEDIYPQNEVEGMKLAAQKGIVVVRAAGNAGNQYEANLDSGLPLTKTFSSGLYNLSNLYISVVSVDQNNRLASYSQTCGSTRGYCLAAPGGDINRFKDLSGGIYSTVRNDSNHSGGYGYMQGTSMAAPVVTGAVALLMSAYPHLNPQEVVQILFQTATYLPPTSIGAKVETDSKGHKYNSDTGYGLINLDAATTPVDGLHFNIKSLATPAYLMGDAESSQLVLPESLVRKFLGALPKTFTAFDGYDRAFSVDTSKLFKTDYTQRTHTLETDFKAFMDTTKMSHFGEKESPLSFDFKSQTSSISSSVPYGFLGMNIKPTQSMTFSSYYTENTLYGRGNYFKRYLENPFVNMKKAYGMDFSYDMNNKTNMSLVFTSGRNAFYQDEEDEDVYDNRMTSFMASLSHQVVSPLTLTVSAGSLREKDSFLGMIGKDSFNFDKTKTNFVGGKIKYEPTDNLSFEASYYRGYTDGVVNTNILGISGVESESMAFNATYKLNDSQQMGLDIYSPLRIVKGQASMTLGTGRHETEDIAYYNTYSADLKPKGREVVLSMFYDDELSKLLDYNLRFGVRLEPDHQQNARPDYFGLFKLNYNY